jgi:hypothetical protein
VPDDQDYADLARLLAHPEDWTSEQTRMMRWMLREQTGYLAEMHPLDARGRKNLQGLLDKLTEAIRVADSSH